MTDPLQALLHVGAKVPAFPPNSRYHDIETATHVTTDGQTVAYLRRRFLPPLEAFTLVQTHSAAGGERPDHLAALYLGDPEQYWRICDANGVMHPNELVTSPGRLVRITLPVGLGGRT